MKYCAENFVEEGRSWDARDLLLKAFDDVQEKTNAYGITFFPYAQILENFYFIFHFVQEVALLVY
jgi:hypothetical protein